MLQGEGLYPTDEPMLPTQKPPARVPVERTLTSYNHAPKQEHPMYLTSANTHGAKKPDATTYTVDRSFIPQEFSNSFNNVKYRDQGLNTSLARSTVHSKLDPQFL